MKLLRNKKQIIPVIMLFFLIIIGFKQTEYKKAPIIKDLKFGSITVNNIKYDHDIVIEKGIVKKRKKGPSQDLPNYSHTPLSEFEYIPWDCDTLVIGIGMSSRLPVTEELKNIAKQKNVTLIMLKTPEAVEFFTKKYSTRINSIFHITC